MASIFKFISGLFHDPRFYKSAEIPADLPVEFWSIFLDMEIGSAVRKSVSVTPWSELSPEIKRLKIYSACSSSNPVVICVVTVLGHGKHVINLPKSEFIDKFGEIQEVDDQGLKDWFADIDKKNEELLSALRSVSRGLQDVLDNLNF